MSNKACCLLFIVSAPSGTGKTTVVERLVKVTDRLKLSRSYTSRAPRGDEVDGVDYNFVSRAAFEKMIAGGEFLDSRLGLGDTSLRCRDSFVELAPLLFGIGLDLRFGHRQLVESRFRP